MISDIFAVIHPVLRDEGIPLRVGSNGDFTLFCTLYRDWRELQSSEGSPVGSESGTAEFPVGE